MSQSETTHSHFTFQGRRYAVETLDQIEEVQRGEEPSLSLRQAALNVRLPFIQCNTCKGNGWTRATLLDTPKQIQILAAAGDKGPLHIQRDRCPNCDGAGGFINV